MSKGGVAVMLVGESKQQNKSESVGVHVSEQSHA